jgi:hypothetical protein
MLPALLRHLGGVDHPASGDADGKLDCAAQSSDPCLTEGSSTLSPAAVGPVRCQQVRVSVVDVKTGQQVGNQFKVDAM